MTAFAISASGIKNIPINNDNIFRFLFENHEIRMNRIHADFISPLASSLHNIDSSSNSYQFGDLFQKIPKVNDFNPNSPKYNKYEDIFDNKTIEILSSLSNGKNVIIDDQQSHKIRIVSIILGNNDMYNELKAYMKAKNMFETNVDNHLEYLLYFYHCTKNYRSNVSDQEVVKFIASKFYSIDKQKLLALPRSVLLEVISSDYLKIESENSLFDFINSIYSINNYFNEDISIAHFYEKVRFSSLGEKKIKEFRDNFDIRGMTDELWKNFSSSNDRSVYSYKKLNDNHFNRYIYGNYQAFLYNENTGNGFDGIVCHLIEKFGEKIVNVSASSIQNGKPEDLLKLNDSTTFFFTKNDNPNQWVQYDFLNSKVRPTHYSIRTTSQFGPKRENPQKWAILGSDTGIEDDWIELDSREEITCLDDINLFHTFHIQNPSKQDEHFRYLRLIQTGDCSSTNNKNMLQLSALEFFGTIITKK